MKRDGSPVATILSGRIVPFGPRGEPSAFCRQPVDSPVAITRLGIAGDEHADAVHHGGPDKALLQYALQHYPRWRAEMPQHAAVLAAPGAFGENLSASGIDETAVCIGDRWRFGETVLEVSQGRQPCWKLGHRFGDAAMVDAVVRTRRSGWYYRVLAAGRAAPGDVLTLLERPHPEWTVYRVFGLLVGGDRDPEALGALCRLEPLAGSWKERARRMCENLAARR